MDVVHLRSSDQLEFESGQILVNKRKAWKGLKLAEHLCAEAKYYFNHFLGDKETFFWDFSASNTPFFPNPNYLIPFGPVLSVDKLFCPVFFGTQEL